MPHIIKPHTCNETIYYFIYIIYIIYILFLFHLYYFILFLVGRPPSRKTPPDPPTYIVHMQILVPLQWYIATMFNIYDTTTYMIL